MKTIKDINLKDKNVVLRCDFNVSINDNKIIDNTKIVNSIPTINYLLENNCKICILSHLGRIKSEEDKNNNSLRLVAEELANLLNHEIKFLSRCFGDDVKDEINKANLGEVILLENTRFMDYPDKLESSNNEDLAKFWASLGDIFVMDAFATSHRKHASTNGISKYLDTVTGFLMDEELKNLDILVNDTPYPFVVFMGGAKVDDKLPIMKELLKRCDTLLVGGGIANSFLKAMGTDIGNSLATDDEEILNELAQLLMDYKEKIILPTDYIKNDDAIFDIGSESINNYKQYIDNAEVIFVNGTCGKYEEEKYSEGTKLLFEELKNSNKRVILGGGDTLSAAKVLGFDDCFNFYSTGGGATLEYVAYRKLNALEGIE